MANATTHLIGKAAVLEEMPDHPAVKALLAWKPEALTRCQIRLRRADPDHRADRDSRRCAAVQAAGYNFFEDMTAVDWFPSSPRFQLSYHILSIRIEGAHSAARAAR